MTVAAPLKVVLSGAGRGDRRRGIEVFFAEAFRALRAHPGLDLTRLGDGPFGAGGAPMGLGALPRQLALMARLKPDVVMSGDRRLLRRLARLRVLTRAPFRIVYSNGGGLAGPFPWADAVHQLSRDALARSLEAGEPPERQFFMPCGFSVPDRPPAGEAFRMSMRQRLGLPVEGPLLLAVLGEEQGSAGMAGGAQEAARATPVAALVDAMAMLPEPRPHLVLFGPSSVAQLMEGRGMADAMARRGIAGARTHGGITLCSLSRVRLAPYYVAADALLISSGVRAARRVLVEGLGRGLPVLADETAGLGHLGGPFVATEDFLAAGAITAGLARLTDRDGAQAVQRWQHVRGLGWACLADRYVAMLNEAAALPLRGSRHSRRVARPPRAPVSGVSTPVDGSMDSNALMDGNPLGAAAARAPAASALPDPAAGPR